MDEPPSGESGESANSKDERWRALRSRYLAEIDQQLGAFSRRFEDERPLSRDERSQLRRAAHNWKGSGGGYGFPAITERGAALEALVIAEADDAALAAALRDVLSAHRALCHDFGDEPPRPAGR